MKIDRMQMGIRFAQANLVPECPPTCVADLDWPLGEMTLEQEGAAKVDGAVEAEAVA